MGKSLALLGLVIVSYGGVYRAEFVFDDVVGVRDNPVVNGSVPTHEAFTRDFWGESPSVVRTYRPVPVLLSAAEWRIGDGAPGVMHIGAVLLHAVMVVALYLVWRGILGEAAAFAGAALMAVLAAPSEAVFAIYGQAEVLAALFATLGLAAHRRSHWSAALFYGLALLSKESAIVAPVAWLWLDRVLPAPSPKGWRRYLAYGGVALAAFGLRQQALGGLVPTRGDLGNPLIGAALPGRLLGAGHAFLTKYLRDLFVPVDWQYDCSYAACLPGELSDPVAWVGLLLAVALFASPLVLARRSPIAAGLLGWTAIFFLPTSNFLMPGPMAYAGRWAYQPLLTICLLGGVAASWLASRAPPRLVWAGWGVLVLGNAGALWNRQGDWETEEAFYNSGLRLASRSAMVHGQLAFWNATRGDQEKAVAHGREAVAIAPDFARAHEWLAASLDLAGESAEAEREFQVALKLAANRGAYHSYATFLARHGELARALAIARQGQKLTGPPLPKLDRLAQSLERDLAEAR